MLLLWNRIGHDNLVQGRSIDAVDGIPAEDAVSYQCVDLTGALFSKEFGCSRDGVACVYDVVDQDAYAVRHVAHQHHAGVLPLSDPGRTSFLLGG